MKKKIIALLLAAAVISTGNPVSAYAAMETEDTDVLIDTETDSSEDQYSYEDVIEDTVMDAAPVDDLGAGKNMTYYLGYHTIVINPDTGEAVVSGKGKGSFYIDRSLGDIAEEEGITITKLTVNSGVNYIEGCEFANCKDLVSVKLPNSVTGIGYDAFDGCEKLTDITLPAGLEYIGEEREKELLVNKITEEGETWTEYGCLADIFRGCPLTTIRLSGTSKYLKVVGNVVFDTKKENIFLYPAGSTAETYQIPDCVANISWGAFRDCTNLKEIQIGEKSKAYLTGGAFEGCGSLKRFAVHKNNPDYSAPGGVLYSKDKTELVAYPAGKDGSEYATAATCTVIDYGAFLGTKLKKLSITNGITVIYGRYFNGNEPLEEIWFPDSLTNINSYFFGYSDPVGIKSIYYTGTEEQWSGITGMAQMLGRFGDNKPAIYYNAEAPAPSAEEDVIFEGGSTPEPQPDDPSGEITDPSEEPVEGLTNFSVEGYLKDDSAVAISFDYTPSTEYDSRKHVVSSIGGKKNAATGSQNPDIVIANFRVTLDGETIPGVTLKSCSYKNNVNPGKMQILPTLAYDTKNSSLKSILNDHKDLKTVLGKMLKPSYKYDKEVEDYIWSYDPVLVNIDQITLDGSTELYNMKTLSAAEKKDLARKDGVLVWDGKKSISYYTRTDKEEDYDENDHIKWITYKYYIPVKATVSGLYYQRVFDLGNNKIVTKKIKLRAGGWSIKKKTYREDGESWSEYSAALSSKSFDYCISEPDAEGGDEEKTTDVSFMLNSEGMWGEKLVKVREDGETWYDSIEVLVAPPGFFKGSLPEFD